MFALGRSPGKGICIPTDKITMIIMITELHVYRKPDQLVETKPKMRTSMMKSF